MICERNWAAEYNLISRGVSSSADTSESLLVVGFNNVEDVSFGIVGKTIKRE